MKRLLAFLLLFALLLPLFACGAAEKPPIEDTLENRRAAMIETALAFYYHGSDVQYDSRRLNELDSRTTRDNSYLPPECAGSDRPLFSVCSSYCHKIVKQALGFDMLDMKQPKYITQNISSAAADDPLVVYKYDTATEQKDNETVSREIWDILQPCDIVCYYRKTNSGHAVFYVGDLFGDHQKLVLESGGNSMNMQTGEDPWDRSGTVKINPMSEKIAPQEIEKYRRIVVLRPAEMEQAHLTPAAETRLRYPRMEMRKTFSQSCYLDAENGNTITVTISVTNHGSEDYHDLVITDPVPQGQRAENTFGGKLKDGVITWKLSVPQGETVTVGYDVTVRGAIGDTVVFESGLVDGTIETRAASFRIGGKPITDEQTAQLIAQKDALIALAKDAPSATEFVNAVYRTAFGVEAQLPPTVGELFSALTEPADENEPSIIAPKTPQTAEEQRLAAMVIPHHIGGKQVEPPLVNGDYEKPQYLDVDAFPVVYRQNNYRAGDVFITVSGSSPQKPKAKNVQAQILLDGDRKVLVYGVTSEGKPYAEVRRFADSVERNLIQPYTVALRPSQAGVFE